LYLLCKICKDKSLDIDGILKEIFIPSSYDPSYSKGRSLNSESISKTKDFMPSSEVKFGYIL